MSRGLSILGVCVLLSISVSLALRNDQIGAHWEYLLLPYVALSTAIAIRGRLKGTSFSRLRYRRGDPSMGAVVGAGLLGVGWLVTQYCVPPGSEGRAWLFQILLSAEGISQVTGTVAFAVLVVAEEWVWRGWMQTQMASVLPTRWAWVGAASLYALIHLPTFMTLADPQAGLNPLLVVAAFGLGSTLGLLRQYTGRLMPGVFAHLVFSYFGATWLLRV